MTDKLVLLDSGEQALANADMGGMLIAPKSFKFGDSGSSPTSYAPTDILGNFLCGGTINYVEVLSPRVARFVMDVDTRMLTQNVIAREAVIFLENNRALARCVFEKPYTIEPNEKVRFSALLVSTRADLSVLNVVMGEHESVPSTPFMHRLPSPNESNHNVVSVLNGIRNPDGSNSPVLALRHGAGALQWAFSDHISVFRGVPDSATNNSFRIDLEVADDEQVIVHAVEGTGAGFTRRFRYKAATQEFVNADASSIPSLAATTIAVWKASQASTQTTNILPPTINIPADWSLTPGANGVPSWAPPKPAARIINTLYTPPGKLNIAALHFVGDGEEFRYSTGSLTAENSNFIYPALGTVSQHRTSFSLEASEISFDTPIYTGVPIDFRIFTRTPSTGTRIEVVKRNYVSDGTNTVFDLGAAPETTAHVFTFVEGMLQPTTTYSTSGRTLTVSSPMPAGVRVEFNTFVYVQDTGYSTRIISQLYTTANDILFLRLPTKPQSKEQVFISESGAHVHADRYEIVEDYVVFTDSLQNGIEVEAWIVENVLAEGTENTNLKGVVTDGYTTNNDIVLLRHATNPLKIPIPKPVLLPGKNIQIAGSWPEFQISYSGEDAGDSIQHWRQSKLEKNTTYAYVTQRIEFTEKTLLWVSCDFASRLGQGFITSEGREKLEFVIGVRSSTSKEPEFGRHTPGSGEAGFSTLSNTQADIAYSNATMTQCIPLDPTTQSESYVDIVAKVRISNANTAAFETILSMNLNILQMVV